MKRAGLCPIRADDRVTGRTIGQAIRARIGSCEEKSEPITGPSGACG